ncbi:MAG TPA: NUDIX hydrolase [Pseudonocardiaceae bacterium]|nr:NUDIX hydrolase [Pseudonocardiaceae bacterium]
MSGYEKVTTAALTIVRDPGDGVTFVAQRRGPFAGHWLLPGGRVEFGESIPDAARRETLEESGCTVGDLTLTGVYEMRGAWNHGAYHLIMFAFLADAHVVLPASATADHDVGEVVQGVPAAVRPHPTVMRILNDAGIADFDPTEIDTALAAHGISMLCLKTGSQARTG